MSKESIVPLSLFGNSTVQRKLEYLDRLTALHGKMPSLQDGNKNMTTRIHAVCNSIEQDLGLQEGEEDITESEKESIVIENTHTGATYHRGGIVDGTTIKVGG